MPLRDLFHPPLEDVIGWESFHSAWINTLVRQLNAHQLPSRYRALPEVRLGDQVVVDLATFERDAGLSSSPAGNGAATAVWTPSRPTQSVVVDFAAHDVFELRVEDRHRGRRLVAAVEIVSPGNKDRPSARRDFAIKCASYLQQGISVVIVDSVTDRHHDLYAELLRQVGLPTGPVPTQTPHLYAVACRTTKVDDQWQLDSWPEGMTLGAPLPTLPLWLADDLPLPLRLEASYEETVNGLRLDS